MYDDPRTPDEREADRQARLPLLEALYQKATAVSRELDEGVVSFHALADLVSAVSRVSETDPAGSLRS